MKHFRRNFILVVVAMVVLSAVTSAAIICGEWRVYIPAAVLLVIVIGCAFGLLGKVTSQMSVFVDALDMNDTSMKFGVGSDDPQLERLSKSMDHIITSYRIKNLELETRKLYYDRILSVMTHEMRNSMTPVVALSDDMKAHPEKYQGEVLDDALDLISEQSSSIQRFLDAYAQLTHLPAPCMEDVAVSRFIGNISDVMRFELSERGMRDDLISYTMGADMSIRIDCDLMRQVIVNLLRNALDAVADRGDEARVELSVTLSDGAPYIRITDNGCGMPSEVMENLFQPFFTTKRGGSGIGLYLARQIVFLHGGDLKVSSTPSHGTTVSITLQ